MSSKKRLLEKSQLYVIIDKNICGRRSIFDIANIIKDKGIDIMQFRDKESDKESILKNAFVLQKLLSDTKTIFIINDYLDIAKIVDADGVHLGQEDLSIEIARRILGEEKIIGISCHSSREALNAQKKGADYISIGPIFSTPLKAGCKAIGLDLLKDCSKRIKIPFFAIGGINENNMSGVRSSGAKRIAVCRSILKAKDIPLTIKKLIKILN